MTELHKRLFPLPAHALRAHRPPPSLIRRIAAGLTGVALFALLALPASAAVNPDDLLPVDEAFAVDARASDPGTIAIHWKIADGYYLYRHRTSVTTDKGFSSRALQLPNGEAHEDEFFGKVETYRKRLTAQLPGEARATTTQVTIKYQGCADAGICYPPQTRTLTVALPAPGAAGASPPADSGVLARLGAPGSPKAPGGMGTSVLFPGGAGKVDAMPLPAEQAFGFEAIAGDGDTLLLRFTPARGYYLYRDNTRLTLTSKSGGIALGSPRWPRGTQHRDEHFGDVVVYFDQIDVPLPLSRKRADASTVTLTATFQGCQNDGICYPPMTRKVDIALPAGTVTDTKVAAGPPATASADADASTGPSGSARDGDPATGAAFTGEDPGDPASISEEALDAAPGLSDSATAARGTQRLSAAAGVSGEAAPGVLLVLLFALIGGLILNLMPCVLPVLSLKVLSLAGSRDQPGAARRQALWYTAGVMVSFAALGALALGLREAGLALGWGFQLQQPLVVALLALLMLALGLSLSGVWQLAGRWTGAGHGLTTRSGPAGDFFTGVLAVVVATPCTAPFMGAALAWAFTAPTVIALAVFLTLGLGLALPFLLIGFVPALARALPRPGAWMETFKQIMAFPLYLTAVWLAWVLAKQLGADAIGLWMVAAVLVALAAWAWNRSRITGRAWATGLAIVALLAAGWPLWLIQTQPIPQPALAQAMAEEGQLVKIPFSEQRLADLRAANRVVFVNMTADWCVTCKANERTVLGRADFQQALADADAAYLVGDWTNVDPALTAFLQRHKAVGVPLYVVFPRGGGEGRILPTLLTPDIVRQALADAATPAEAL